MQKQLKKNKVKGNGLTQDVVVVILNYNSAQTTITCVKNLRHFYENLDILVVDNCSNDGSEKQLASLDNDPFVNLLYNNINKGYASGNNYAIHWIEKNLVKKYVVIMNPDIVVLDDVLNKLYCVLELHSDIGVVSSRLLYNGVDRGIEDFGWKFPGIKYILLSGTMIGTQIHVLSNELYTDIIRGDIQYVDVVPGCFFMIAINDLSKVGYFDEDTFLYYEETILASKMKKLGKKEAILLNTFVDHRHNEKDVLLKDPKKKQLDRQWYHESKNIYVRKYASVIKPIVFLSGSISKIDVTLKKIFTLFAYKS